MERGPITVMSHSISVDPAALDRAAIVARNKKTDQVVDRRTGKVELRFDPNGEFTLTVDKNAREIVVQHSYKGSRISEYRGESAEAIEQQLARDVAISEISHALYIGRELAKKEFELRALRKAEGGR
jgi:thymidylate synthase